MSPGLHRGPCTVLVTVTAVPGQKHTCDLRHVHGHSPHMNTGLHVDTETHSNMVVHPHTVTHTGPAPHAGSAVRLYTAPLRHSFMHRQHLGQPHTHTGPAVYLDTVLHQSSAPHRHSTALGLSPHRRRHNWTWAHSQPKATRVGTAETRPNHTTRRRLTPSVATYNPTQETAPHTDGAYAQTQPPT